MRAITKSLNGLDMRLIKQFFLSVVTLFILSATANAALIHMVDNNGILTGAKGIDINGIEYDVEFKDGTCRALFSGCDNKSDFLFKTSPGPTGYIASWTLSKYVFVAQWDSSPHKIKGCENSPGQCSIITPYDLLGDTMRMSYFNNTNSESMDEIQFGSWYPFIDTTPYAFTFAIWSLSKKSEVNESGTLVLLMMGMIALLVRKRLQYI